MKKLILSLFLVAIAATNLFASDTKVNGIWYDFDSSTKTASVTYRGSSYTSFRDEYTGSVVIPKIVTYNNTTYSVTTIGNHAFCACKDLTSVTIPNSVTTIGNSAFSSCSGLTSITIPNSVTTIGNSAFSSCSGLTSITIPNSVTTIGNSAFSSCSSLPIIDNLRYADTYLIKAVDMTLSTYTIKDGTKWIGNSAFSSCSELTSVTIPNSITTIGDYAFSSCSGLTSIMLPNSITTIGNYTFEDCSSLTSISIPNSVTTIGDNAFSSCTGLTSVTIPNSVKTIGNQAFYACTNLNSINIPSSVTSIGSGAFEYCLSLPVIDNLRYADTYLIGAVDETLLTCSIKDGTKWIGREAFKNCKALTSVSIPNSVTEIGYSAFYACTNLTSIAIPNSVTTIGGRAFHCCYVLASASIGNSVSTIGEMAFSGCYVLSTITIPNSVTTIGKWAFHSCGLTSIISYAQNPPLCGESCFYNVSKSISVYVPARSINSYKQAEEWNSFTNIKGNPDDYAVIRCSTKNGTVSGAGTYIKGDKCSLKVTPNYGYHFTQWNDNDKNNPRTIIVTKDSTFIAQIEISQFKLTVNSSDGTMGYVSGSGTFNFQTQHNISATAYYGYHFTQWSDGSTENPRKLVLTKDTTFIAQFAPNNYQISVQSSNLDMGYTSGSGSYVYQSQQSISATANYGYHFTQWSDGNTDNPRKVIVTRDTTFTAEFAKNIYTISVEAEHGSVTGGGDYEYLSNVQLTATADEHYHFVRWSDWNTNNPREITVTENTTYTAEFAPNNYQVTVQSANSEMGYANGSGSYVYQSEQSISATANYGYHFTQWSDGNTDNPRTIQVLSDTTFTADFAKNIYTISVEAEHGSITGGGDYEYLSNVQLIATADEHYHFAQWSDWNTNNPRQITVEEDKTYTAIFSIDQHTISAYAEHGSVSGTGRYDYGTEATLFVIPDFGYEFAAWSDGSTDNPRTVLVTENASYYSTCVLSTNGFCGNNLYWEYKDGSLIITGQGAMYNYSSNEVPWLLYCNNIKKVELSDGITNIGDNAFSGCSALTSITIPNSVTTIGEYAFYGCPLSSLAVPHSVQYINKGAFKDCSRLVSLSLGSGLWEIGDYAFSGDYRIEEITSYAEITPTAYTNTFNGITKQNVYLYVPENCIRRYQVDPNWSEFDIRTKSADKKPMDDENPVVTPTDQDVTITWPITNGTDTYTLTITKNGEVVCVLTFNANGQLTNIAFAAPGHNGARQAPAAMLTAQGYQFTVTGLNPGTAYDYNVTATDAGGKTLAEHKGNFNTTGGTGFESVHGSQPTMHKVLRNGQLLIETNNATYTPMGQKVK